MVATAAIGNQTSGYIHLTDTADWLSAVLLSFFRPAYCSSYYRSFMICSLKNDSYSGDLWRSQESAETCCSCLKCARKPSSLAPICSS